MVGNQYWSTGIKLRYMPDDRWSAHLDFFDDGFCEDESTEGNLHTRYFINLTVAIDTLIADAERLGIVFRLTLHGAPYLWYEGDGENKSWPPPANYRQILAEQAQRIGWITNDTPMAA